jgi:hypothetical protein
MMRHAAHVPGRGLRGQDRQPGIDLVGVRADDFRAEPFRDREGKRGLADAGRPREMKDFRRALFDARILPRASASAKGNFR